MLTLAAPVLRGGRAPLQPVTGELFASGACTSFKLGLPVHVNGESCYLMHRWSYAHPVDDDERHQVKLLCPSPHAHPW